MEKEKFTIYSAGAGSGKTYTLAQQILKVLWEQDQANYFQHVLAITFTNKAANEMKERLLKYLFQAIFYDKQPDHTKKEIEQFVSSLGYTMEYIQVKSLAVFRSILHSYSRLSVSTIDKFNLGLIKSFSKELGVSQSFDVELDTNQVLKEALELLIATVEDPSPLWSNLYRETMLALNESKTWNLKSKYYKELQHKFNDQHAVYLQFFELLNQEELTALDHQIKECHSAADIDFKRQIQLFLETCNSNGLTNADFAGVSSGALGVVKKWALGDSPKFATAHKSYLKESFVHPNSKNPFPHEVEKKLLTNFGRLLELLKQKTKFDEIRSNLGSMLVWSTLRKKISDVLAPEGKMLISDFNKIISNSIVLQSAPYIYEKIGVNYKHYFIDEFQDTSALQWSNFLPLLQEAYANGDTAMLVGDVKQAIYSFRGGDSSLMLNVLDGKEPMAFKTKELQNNYRSFANIVTFNNSFYKHLKDYLVDASFAEKYTAQQNPIKKHNGYVEILLNPEIKGEKELQKQALCDTFIDQIQRAKSAGYAYSEMCVLTHKNDHILEISELLQQHGVRSFSSHNQKINQNPIIQAIIALMRALDSNYRDEYLWEFWHNFHVAKGSESPYSIDFLQFKGQQKNGLVNAFKFLGVEDTTINWEEKELYTLVAELIDNLGFYEEGGPFVQRFIDFVFDFQESKGSDLSLFLDRWKDQENGLYAASSNLDAVQIMTVHKSKGLEFPVVFLPYFIKTINTKNEKIYIPSGLPQMPIAVVGMKASMGKEQHPYWEETQAYKAKMEMDVINSYYVATTRASEQLYIIVAEDRAKDSFNSGVLSFAELDEGFRLGNPQRESIPNQKDSHILPRQLSLSYTSWQGSLSIARDVHPLKNRAQSKGTLIHKAFSKLQDIKDASSVKQWLSQQPLDQPARNELVNWLEQLVINESLNPFFKDCLQVYNERDFLTLDNAQLRPDRFVEFEPNQYAIIDYKTGKARDKDKVQLEGYKQQLSELGYTIKKTLLIYFSDRIEIIAV